MSWVNRTTRQHISRRSPRGMEKTFGGSFVDGDGNGISTAEWIFSPDLSAVTKGDDTLWAIIYWIVTGDVITLMSPAQRQAVDDQTTSDSRDREANTIQLSNSFAKAFAEILLDEINILRGRAGLMPRTLTQFRNALRAKLDV